MVRLILNGAGRVVDFDIEPPEGSFDREMATCVLCGDEYNAAFYRNNADTCKHCWLELQKAMRAAIDKALSNFTPQEVKLLDEWGNLEDLFYGCVDARIKGSKPKHKK